MSSVNTQSNIRDVGVDNPPAFPCEAQGDRSVPPEHDYIRTGIHSSKFPGMTLRDYFAGQVLQSLVASVGSGSGEVPELGRVVRATYIIADAMLAERAKAGQP